MRFSSTLRVLAFLLPVLVLAACGDRTRLDASEVLPVDELYAEAHKSMTAGNYDRAVKYYKRLVARFPFGRYTEQARDQVDPALFEHIEHRILQQLIFELVIFARKRAQIVWRAKGRFVGVLAFPNDPRPEVVEAIVAHSARHHVARAPNVPPVEIHEPLVELLSEGDNGIVRERL